MTIHHSVDVEFEALLALSSTVIIAEPASPHRVPETVPVVEAGKEYPPYQMEVLRYRVREVLYGSVSPGDTIEVVPATQARQLKVHRAQVTSGVAPSLYVERYRGIRGDKDRPAPSYRISPESVDAVWA